MGTEPLPSDSFPPIPEEITLPEEKWERGWRTP